MTIQEDNNQGSEDKSIIDIGDVKIKKDGTVSLKSIHEEVDVRLMQKISRPVCGNTLLRWYNDAIEMRNDNMENQIYSVENCNFVDVYKALQLRNGSELGSHTIELVRFFLENASTDRFLYNWGIAIGPALAAQRYLVAKQVREASITREALQRVSDILLLNIETMDLDTMQVDMKTRKVRQKYVAVTHSWGQWQVADDRTVLDGMHGVPVLNDEVIFNTLRSFIDYIAITTEYKYLWIDWACVDQDDIENQSADLHLQRTAYALADKVLCILRGPAGKVFTLANEKWGANVGKWFTHDCDMGKFRVGEHTKINFSGTGGLTQHEAEQLVQYFMLWKVQYLM